jgi:hypothetical protein
MLKRYDEILPPLFYIVTTSSRLKELVKSGWSDPRFYYNRAADDVAWIPAVNINSEGPSDDALMPVIVEATATAEQNRDRLTTTIRQIEQSLAARVGVMAQGQSQSLFYAFIAEHVMDPLKLKEDQEWIGVGIAMVLSGRYVAQLIGMNASDLVRVMSADNPRNPMRPAVVDLLHPTPRAEIRQEAVGAYIDAYRRKATRVVAQWVAGAGDDAIPKVLTALRQGVPPDGPGLLKLVQQQTGTDLSGEVGRGP